MNWKKLEEPDGTYAVDEGESYLFAIKMRDGSWEYFVDSLVWDSETAPYWRDAEHGWDGSESEMWFTELSSPEADQPAPTETAPQGAPECGCNEYGVCGTCSPGAAEYEAKLAAQGAPALCCSECDGQCECQQANASGVVK